MTLSTKPKISIGLPVYNGENYIRKALDSILSQTFTNFEVLISDNCSEDSTQNICKEFMERDDRIRLIRQEKNMGGLWNFNYVLQKAQGEYFVWLAADDYWLPQFLEKNMSILESNKNIVGSISKIGTLGKNKRKIFETKSTDSLPTRFYKRIRRHFSPFGVVSLYGTYEERAAKLLKKGTGGMIYAVYRTKELQDSLSNTMNNESVRDYIDSVTILDVLKYGHFHAVDEFLLYRSTGGVSSSGFVQENIYKKNIFQLIFPWHPITMWCLRNIGIKFFFKNLDYFSWYACYGPTSFLFEIIQIFRKIIFK